MFGDWPCKLPHGHEGNHRGEWYGTRYEWNEVDENVWPEPEYLSLAEAARRYWRWDVKPKTMRRLA
jgi:hypothetical protein